MSDIPVGSPPAPPGRHAAPGGWYDDPVDRTQERYWDGWQWARTTRPRESTTASPPTGSRPTRPTGPLTAGANATTADGVALAPWLWRVLAAAIDSAIGLVVLASLLVGLPTFRSAVARSSATFDAVLAAQRAGTTPPPLDLANIYSTQQRWLLMGLMLAFGLAYQLLFLRWRGATPGKGVCGLKVVPVDEGRYAGRLAWGAIVVRSLIWVIPGVVGALSLFRIADALFPLWQARRQAIHDIVARTQVVRPTRR